MKPSTMLFRAAQFIEKNRTDRGMTLFACHVLSSLTQYPRLTPAQYIEAKVEDRTPMQTAEYEAAMQYFRLFKPVLSRDRDVWFQLSQEEWDDSEKSSNSSEINWGRRLLALYMAGHMAKSEGK